MNPPSLTIVRHLKAPPAKVFDAWTKPEMIAAWFGPRNGSVERVDADARVGGHYRIVIRGQNGETFDVFGTYRTVEPGRLLVFTWAWQSTPERESLVSVALRAVGEGTELTLLHEGFFDDEARDMHNAGWEMALENFEKWLAAQD